MKAVDHYLLALALRRAFMVGSVEPDRNVFTYLRGSRGMRKFSGHNAENSRRHIAICLVKLREAARWGVWEYFVLDSEIHYIADSFIYPHNAMFKGTMRGHIAYEAGLQALVESAGFGDCGTCPRVPFSQFGLFLDAAHAEYVADASHGPDFDISHIRTATAAVFSAAVEFARLKAAREEAPPIEFPAPGYVWAAARSRVADGD